MCLWEKLFCKSDDKNIKYENIFCRVVIVMKGHVWEMCIKFS